MIMSWCPRDQGQFELGELGKERADSSSQEYRSKEPPVLLGGGAGLSGNTAYLWVVYSQLCEPIACD